MLLGYDFLCLVSLLRVRNQFSEGIAIMRRESTCIKQNKRTRFG